METNMSAVSINHPVFPSYRRLDLQGSSRRLSLRPAPPKLAGVPFMVDLFAQIGLGQWFRVVTRRGGGRRRRAAGSRLASLGPFGSRHHDRRRGNPCVRLPPVGPAIVLGVLNGWLSPAAR